MAQEPYVVFVLWWNRLHLYSAICNDNSRLQTAQKSILIRKKAHLEMNFHPLSCNSATPNWCGRSLCILHANIQTEFSDRQKSCCKIQISFHKGFFINKFFEKDKWKDNFLISMCIYKRLSMPARSWPLKLKGKEQQLCKLANSFKQELSLPTPVGSAKHIGLITLKKKFIKKSMKVIS